MPTYDYECLSCGARKEVFHSINAKPQISCPDCQAVMSKMLGTGSGIIFKGGGFYATDYRSDSYKKGVAADKPVAVSPSKS